MRQIGGNKHTFWTENLRVEKGRLSGAVWVAGTRYEVDCKIGAEPNGQVVLTDEGRCVWFVPEPEDPAAPGIKTVEGAIARIYVDGEPLESVAACYSCGIWPDPGEPLPEQARSGEQIQCSECGEKQKLSRRAHEAEAAGDKPALAAIYAEIVDVQRRHSAKTRVFLEAWRRREAKGRRR